MGFIAAITIITVLYTAPTADGSTELEFKSAPAARPVILKYDQEVSAAKKQYEYRVNQARLACIVALKAALEAETKKGNLDGALEIKAKLQELERADDMPAKASEMSYYYLGMLGTYSTGKGPTAYVNLCIPNGENIYDDSTKVKLRGISGLSFFAKARLVVPVDGVYRVEAGRACELTIGNQKLGAKELDNYGHRNSIDIPLKRGTYPMTLSVGDNGSQMREAFVRVSDIASGKMLPIIVTQQEIEDFLKPAESGEARVVLGNFDRNASRIRTSLPTSAD